MLDGQDPEILTTQRIQDLQIKPITKEKIQSIINKKLLIAVEENNISDVKNFLNQGADINAKDHEGLTSLHYASLDSEWPKDTITVQDIEQFLEHLVFAVNQPNVSELDEILDTEIGNDCIQFKNLTSWLVVNHIKTKVFDWYKKEQKIIKVLG